MVRQWIVRPLAESDIDDAARWYEERQPGLGLRFLDALDQLCERIRAAPMQFPVVRADLRRALLQTFPIGERRDIHVNNYDAPGAF